MGASPPWLVPGASCLGLESSRVPSRGLRDRSPWPPPCHHTDAAPGAAHRSPVAWVTFPLGFTYAGVNRQATACMSAYGDCLEADGFSGRAGLSAVSPAVPELLAPASLTNTCTAQPSMFASLTGVEWQLTAVTSVSHFQRVWGPQAGSEASAGIRSGGTRWGDGSRTPSGTKSHGCSSCL